MLLTSSWAIDITLIFATTLFLFYKYFTRHFDHWKRRGVFYVKPIPFFGNFYDIFTFKTTIAGGLKSLYEQTDEDYFGAFVFDKPVLILRSPKLIENILVKDFTYFRDRSLAFPKHNPIIANFLLLQHYSQWKKTRTKLNPIFATGKLKAMLHTAKLIQDTMGHYLEKHRNAAVDAKELCSKYSTEVVVRSFFGMSANCFENDNSDVQQIGRRIFDFSFKNAIIQALYVFKPEWVDLFKLNFMNMTDQEYLLKAIKDVVESRKKANTDRNRKAADYIDMIIEAQENETNNYSDSSKPGLVEIMSNSIQFYIAGTETMSAAQSFTLYELAIHPKIQDRLRKEVISVVEKYGDITYEALQDMQYLEFCLLETMRKYVSLQIIDRKAVEDYKVPGTDFVIEKGTVVYIPFYAIHMDEKYYPNPEEYIPERFEERSVNTGGINFMPFGGGPRACIGERFALIMSKMLMASIVLSYELEPCEKTPIPIIICTKSFTFQSTVGLPIMLKPLSK